MCLSVPMKVEEIKDTRARCTAMGEERWVDLMFMADQPPKIGEYVIVHLKFAQRIVCEEEALKSYALFDEILDVLDKSS
ncbi:MAG: HypC/HybG/HupF family hydrogenase formation chaperone [Rhodospirillaceae bacterium]|nr:MAG: HypC/HybG/HupF family hydrogenase formation chaperone [Rhodospirillaceae bacterium]